MLVEICRTTKALLRGYRALSLSVESELRRFVSLLDLLIPRTLNIVDISSPFQTFRLNLLYLIAKTQVISQPNTPGSNALSTVLGGASPLVRRLFQLSTQLYTGSKGGGTHSREKLCSCVAKT